MGIRAYLAAMAAVLLIPLIVLSGFGLDRLLRTERATAVRAVLETARAVSLAVDQELASAEAVLRVLAQSNYLASGDYAAFHAQATEAVTTPSASIVLLDDEGRLILDTAEVYGATPMRPHVRSAEFRAHAGRTPSTLDLARAPESGTYTVGVAVPLELPRGRHVLIKSIAIDHFSRIFAERKLPNDWIAGVFDRRFLTIARSQPPLEFVGQPGSDDIRRAASSASEGQIRHPSREGIDIYDVFTRSPRSGWLVAIGVPAASLDATARKAVAVAAFGTLVTIGLAGAIVFALGRRLGNSIGSLMGAATALGRGEALPPHVSSVREIGNVRTALESAHAALARESEARSRAEAERLQLFESEQAARQTAEQQNRAKDEFLAMLGHELRNPLSAISGAVALMKASPAPDEHGHQARDVIARQTQHLSRIVDDLLDLSRVMTGKVNLALTPLDLAQVCRHCVETMRAAGRFGTHTVSLHAEPVWIDADTTRLEQIIVNLLSNALKYTPHDGRIELHVAAEADEAILRVRDTGLGIPEHLLPHVFEVFVQGEQSLDRAKGGLGIGLALVQRLIRLHGGTVQAQSPGNGRGSVFTVRLPRRERPTEDATNRAVSSPPSPGLRVLVVDDHDDSRTMLGLLLQQNGHEAIEAVDGIDAVKVALTRRPDVAVVDIGLPGIDGYEVARRLRALPNGKQTALIALTGYGQEEDKELAFKAGFDLHLVKPLDAERLARALREVTHTRPPEGAGIDRGSSCPPSN